MVTVTATIITYTQNNYYQLFFFFYSTVLNPGIGMIPDTDIGGSLVSLHPCHDCTEGGGGGNRSRTEVSQEGALENPKCGSRTNIHHKAASD